jgi:hypothetical protein
MDIITCIKSIDNIIKKNIKITNKTVNNLSSILVRFRLEAIPIEYSEKLLSMIGNTMEYDDCDETFLLFVSNPIFVQVISKIIIDFNNKIIPVKKDNGDHHLHHDFIASFTSHYCYELVLYIWLGFIDRTKFLKVLTSTIDMSMIEKIFISISVAIPYDYLYLTQVIIIISTYVYFHVIIFIVNFFLSCLS